MHSTSASSWLGYSLERQDAIGLPVHQQKCEECQAVIDEPKGSVWYARTPAGGLGEPSISAARRGWPSVPGLEDPESGGSTTTEIRVDPQRCLEVGRRQVVDEARSAPVCV